MIEQKSTIGYYYDISYFLFLILCTNFQFLLLVPWSLEFLLLCFVFFQLIQYIHFVFDPIFDNHILSVNQRLHNILFAVRGIWHNLILDRSQFTLFNFSLRFCKWYLNVKCSSSNNQRHLIWEIIIIFCPLILKFTFLVIFLSLDLDRTSSVLPEFKDILFAFSHSAIDFKSQLIFLFMSLRYCLYIVYLYHLQNDEFLRN